MGGGEGRGLPERRKQGLRRGYEGVELGRAQRGEGGRGQRGMVEEGENETVRQVAALAELRGIGSRSSWVCATEVFGWRRFRNRKELASCVGVPPMPYQSGGLSREQGIRTAQFKTLKDRPEFPGRFGSPEDALGFCRSFFPWYNQEHYHSGIGWLTPASVHYGRAEEILRKRKEVLRQACARHPERFVRGEPEPPAQPEAVWINPPVKDQPTEDLHRKLEEEVSQSC